ncbi:MAG: hypothetical protein COW02_18025 [Comamonadaceae bacterium CG12_big_fil_rev_8_21_14_0_65_59_15]|nr:MAG: hypothetical protein COW02_18025 [Comamonadaceae bacterium CG12_big_fil_rev_8_21_14_0_65_59_15]
MPTPVPTVPRAVDFWRKRPGQPCRCSRRDKPGGLIAGTVVDSDEVRPGVVFDFDVNGRVLGIEMLDVSLRTDNPKEIALELVG